MKIEIDLDFLKSKNLSPSEYVVAYLIFQNLNETRNPTIEQSLEKKGFLVEGKIINLFVDTNCKLWIDEWLKLWPTGLYNGYRVSGNRAQVINRMNKFLKDNPEYNKDIIFKATQNYLNEKRKTNYSYVKKNSKFISDSDGSVLEAECYAVLNGKSTDALDNKVFL